MRAMSDIRRVTPDFAVAPQLTTEDVKTAAAQGFRTLICNRPDNEAPNQMLEAEARAVAEAAGLEFHALPFQGPPPPEMVEATEQALASAPGPVLAYCRTGTRSITVWALAQALAGSRKPDEILSLAAKAGYDLSSFKVALERLSPA